MEHTDSDSRNVRENVVQCRIRKACDGCDTEVGSYVGGESGNEFLALTKGPTNFNLVSGIEVATAAKLQDGG
jgi:hypothetical protein